MTQFLQSLTGRRAERFAPYHGVGVRTPEEAIALFDEAGFCLFSDIPGVELPSLSRAVCPGEPVDTWGWKDSLPAARVVYYGAVFHPVAGWAARPGFVSLKMLAPLYSLAPILQFGGDRSMLRRYSKISLEAILIAETLERDGALSTGELRTSTGLAGKANASKFSRALAEAQANFLVTKIGVTSITRANYGYIWNTFERAFPQTVPAVEALTETEAAAAIIQQYVETVLTVPLERIGEMLSLAPRVLQPAARQLIDAGVIGEVEEEGKQYLVIKE